MHSLRLRTIWSAAGMVAAKMYVLQLLQIHELGSNDPSSFSGFINITLTLSI